MESRSFSSEKSYSPSMLMCAHAMGEWAAIASRRRCRPGKSKLDKYRPEIKALLANGSTQKFIARRYNTTQANLHNWIKKHGFKKPKTGSNSVVDSVPMLG
jgi:transposase-like protein